MLMEARGALAASPNACAADDQRTLELGDTGEHFQNHRAGGDVGIRPGIGQSAKPGVDVAQPLGEVGQIACCASQAV
jgi:hypothetical protein